MNKYILQDIREGHRSGRATVRFCEQLYFLLNCSRDRFSSSTCVKSKFHVDCLTLLNETRRLLYHISESWTVTIPLSIVWCKFHYRLPWKKASFRQWNIDGSSSTSLRLKLTFYLSHDNFGHPWIECNMQEWIILGIILLWAVKLTDAWCHNVRRGMK